MLVFLQLQSIWDMFHGRRGCRALKEWMSDRYPARPAISVWLACDHRRFQQAAGERA